MGGTAATPDIFDQLASGTTTQPAPGTITGNVATMSAGQPTGTAPAPKPTGDIFDQLVAGTPDTATKDGPTLQPYSEAAFGKYTTPEDYLRWATTQPENGPDAKPGEYEAWTRAHLSKTD